MPFAGCTKPPLSHERYDDGLDRGFAVTAKFAADLTQRTGFGAVGQDVYCEQLVHIRQRPDRHDKGMAEVGVGVFAGGELQAALGRVFLQEAMQAAAQHAAFPSRAIAVNDIQSLCRATSGALDRLVVEGNECGEGLLPGQLVEVKFELGCDILGDHRAIRSFKVE